VKGGQSFAENLKNSPPKRRSRGRPVSGEELKTLEAQYCEKTDVLREAQTVNNLVLDARP
jgi:hypothetical protein